MLVARHCLRKVQEQVVKMRELQKQRVPEMFSILVLEDSELLEYSRYPETGSVS